MTRDDITRMAREAKGHPYTNKYAPGETAFAFSIDRLEHFVALVAAAEREACAKVCDFEVASLTAIDEPRPALAVGICAAVIRARGQQ
jgi:hypothetical protein